MAKRAIEAMVASRQLLARIMYISQRRRRGGCWRGRGSMPACALWRGTIRLTPALARRKSSSRWRPTHAPSSGVAGDGLVPVAPGVERFFHLEAPHSRHSAALPASHQNNVAAGACSANSFWAIALSAPWRRGMARSSNGIEPW